MFQIISVASFAKHNVDKVVDLNQPTSDLLFSIFADVSNNCLEIISTCYVML